MLSIIERNQKKRFSILIRLYELSNGNTLKSIKEDAIRDILDSDNSNSEKFSIDSAWWPSKYSSINYDLDVIYLEREGLIETPYKGGAIGCLIV